MFYNPGMDALSCLKLLAGQMSLEPAEPPFAARAPRGEGSIYPAVLPNGRRIRLLKTLLSSACERDCLYCPFRAGRDFRRAAFGPERFARLFMKLRRADLADGLFISSALAGSGARTQDRLLETAEILRRKLGFRGYIHLKIMPGAEKGQVLRAMQLADRVSVNLEAPNAKRLARLAPGKIFLEELLRPLEWVDEIRRTRPPAGTWRAGGAQRERWPSSTTQFVVGGADESDLELLTAADRLYRRLGLSRAYFMAFRPIADTPLEGRPPTPAIRALRLYQASFLLRDYGFDLEDLPFGADGRLPLPTDPKLAWAGRHLRETPLEINRAGRRELLRVPGIGPKGARAILCARRERRLCDLSQLRKLGVAASRAAPFVLLDGKAPAAQLRLFK